MAGRSDCEAARPPCSGVSGNVFPAAPERILYPGETVVTDDDSPDGLKPEKTDADSGSATVLVADDERDVLDAVEQVLVEAGHDVRTAQNGGEALVGLGPDIDVVVLDRRMPGMSGDEVLEHVREWHSDLFVVLMAAVDPGVDVVDAAFDEYLVKPVDGDELVAAVEGLLRFDRYEALISECITVSRKYATLRATLENPDDSEALVALRDRRETVCGQLEEAVADLSDGDLRRVLGRVHGELPDTGDGPAPWSGGVELAGSDAGEH